MASHRPERLKSPLTPVCRFLLKCVRPPTTLGKRTRSAEDDEADGRRSPVLLCPQHPGTSPRMAVALQNDDPHMSTDALIITMLSTIPFCCHAHLCSMDRDNLAAVALALNARLPHALHIDINPSRPVHLIRAEIELMVGLRRESALPVMPPHAPRRTRSLRTRLGPERPQSQASRLSSPLAGRSKSQYLPVMPRNLSLGVLNEEEEEHITTLERSSKRRKTRSDFQAVYSSLNLRGSSATDPESVTPITTPKVDLPHTPAKPLPFYDKEIMPADKTRSRSFPIDPSFLDVKPRYAPRYTLRPSTPKRSRSYTVSGQTSRASIVTTAQTLRRTSSPFPYSLSDVSPSSSRRDEDLNIGNRGIYTMGAGETELAFGIYGLCVGIDTSVPTFH